MSLVVNVCGNAHAGTTVLHLMLANSSEAMACGEVYARFRPWRPHHYSPVCACGGARCPVWEALAGTTEDVFHERALQLDGVTCVVDSSKRLDWIADVNRWAAVAGYRVRNVLIWKEPKQLAYSLWKRQGRADTWRESFVGYQRAALDAGLDLVAICYTDLVANPAVTLRALCAEVGLDYSAHQEEFWRSEHHHLFGSDAVRKQLADGRPGISPRLAYPPEFERDFSGLLPERPADEEVVGLIESLRALAPTRETAGR